MYQTLLVAWALSAPAPEAPEIYALVQVPTKDLLDQNDKDIYQALQLSGLSREEVIRAALDTANVKLWGNDDPVKWLTANVDAQFVESGIIRIGLRCGGPPREVAALINALADAYDRVGMEADRQRGATLLVEETAKIHECEAEHCHFLNLASWAPPGSDERKMYLSQASQHRKLADMWWPTILTLESVLETGTLRAEVIRRAYC